MFESINAGYDSVFTFGKLSLGLVAPVEQYAAGPVPALEQHIERIQLAEQLGFRAIWLRDVPFNVPAFGDAGQIFDPFVYLGLLAGQTKDIALGVASAILPLRHPAHVAKAAASADVLSGGRVILGVASGDRPDEYPAMNVSFEDRGKSFRDSYAYIRRMSEPSACFDNTFGQPQGDMDMLPKPSAGRLPLLITGSSQQSPEWIARHGDGWMLYPRSADLQAGVIDSWRERRKELGRLPAPAMQPLYIDLVDDDDCPPTPIHLGFRTGVNYLMEYLQEVRQIGVNHVALNLRFQSGVPTAMERLATEVLPHFHQ